MANYDLIFDLGSQYISAALKKDGFSDKIPTAVAYGGQDGQQIIAVGVEAVNLYNAQTGIKLSRPIFEGAVIDVEGVKALICALLDRLVNRKLTAFSRYCVYCIVPCGMISSDKKAIEGIFLGLGARSVAFNEAPLADSLQLFEEFRARQGVVVDIGYDCADFAVVAENRIVSGCTLYYAGKLLTEAIAERVKNKYSIKLSFDQAEYLKIHCASLYPNDTTVASVTGQNIEHGIKETVNISSRELYDTIVEFVKRYVTVIRTIISSAPDQIAPMLKTDGVMLCGGGARLAGLDLFLHTELGIPVRVAFQPEDVSIAGMMKLNKQQN